MKKNDAICCYMKNNPSHSSSQKHYHTTKPKQKGKNDMKKLNRIFAIFLIVALLGGCFSVSAWDEPLGEAEGEAGGEIYVDTQPEPSPVESYCEVTASVFEDPGEMPLPLAEANGEVAGFIPVVSSEDDWHYDNEADWAETSNSPFIFGQPIVVSNDYTFGSLYWTYLRTSSGCTNVAICYLKDGKVETAKTFSADEFVSDYDVDGGWDWIIPYYYSPTGDASDYSRTVLIRASSDGGQTWSDIAESNRFVVMPSENLCVALDVPFYSQTDEAWSGTMISSRTISAVGCTTTCIAMLYSYYQNARYTLADLLGILDYSGNDVLWSSVTDMGFQKTYCDRTGEASITASVMNGILNELRAGHPVMIGATKTGTSTGNQHWVIVTGYCGDGVNLKAEDFTIQDPNSTNRTTLEDFLRYRPYLYMLVS